MKLKKITALLMAALLTLSMTACGSSDSGSSSSSEGTENTTAATEEPESEEPAESGDADSYTIGICQMLEHPALDAATEGFQDACKDKFGEDNVDFDVQNAQGEQAMCSTIVNNFVSADVDLMLANAHPSPIMRLHWKSATGQGQPASTFLEPAIWRRLTSRRI